MLVVCKDVTSEHMAREALNLINEELKHRVKNTLTVLGAVATQTFRDVASKADLEKYQGRLAAFGRAHDLLTAANWAAAPLQDVISTALIPYRTTRAGLRPQVLHLLSSLDRPSLCPWQSTNLRPTL